MRKVLEQPIWQATTGRCIRIPGAQVIPTRRARGLPPGFLTSGTRRRLIRGHSSTGERAIWFMKNGVLTSTVNLPMVPLTWGIADH